MDSKLVRKNFVDFFKTKSHQINKSASLVVKNDSTLMFVNSGMVPFKEFFLENSTPKYKRITNSQKCLRVSGKHNDLDEVGYDTYHHTFFEMLGNWSFGDYFKEDAINWAWELLTDIYKIDKNDLYITVFEGSKDSDNLPIDQEAIDIWKKIIPESQILYGNKKDNFWEMGEQGPCGPCSEIHVDIRSKEEKDKISAVKLVNKDHPQVLEIWNLVFMQYNRKASGKLEDLPNKHIDTGLGLERLCMVLQDVKSNYDTDLFVPIIKEIEALTDRTYHGKDSKTDVAMRVISDHVRAVAFSIADGKLPSNNGSGYVIRRILRRAVRYGFSFLGIKTPFIFKLVKVLSVKLGDNYPELVSQKQLIENVIKEEELSFLRTLDQGLVLLDELVESSTDKLISGKKAFELYDTYGFPIDLTSLILSEKNLSLDIESFNKELQIQKNRSKAASESSAEDWIVLIDDPVQEFVGYEILTTKLRITKYRKVNSKKGGNLFQLVFNLTPFYAEGGGQIGDKGHLESGNGDITYILDTKKENNITIHFVKELPKNINELFTAVVDSKIRSKTESNHSATHLLHQALREILGKHVEQKGSSVHSKYLRFDFSHYEKISDTRLIQIESYVNSKINDHLPLIENREVPMQEAIDNGAIALFGEKYGDVVRTIKFGDSVELCGGTHVKNTAEIWQFKIKSEGAIASGIRRIEAITSFAVKDFYEETNKQLTEIRSLLNNTKNPVISLAELKNENSKLKKEVEALLKDKIVNIKSSLTNEIKEINGINFLVKKVDLDVSNIKKLSFELAAEKKNLFMFFMAENNSKANIVCYISKELVKSKGFDAREEVKQLSTLINGSGGGQDFFSTAGGSNIDGIAQALKQASKRFD
ncbi:alanine--tRNA ligase [Flavobacteriaceae bacterium]|nr:alanine--tRNA ligase [Flavobacteriaceae bacterium]MDC1492632.1 alanine--tRNA ligase [Flavobacteriaceae bacterium]